MNARLAIQATLVSIAWLWFLVSPLLFLGPGFVGSGTEYAQAFLSAGIFWVPLLLASAFSFFGPPAGRLFASIVVLAIPSFVVMAYGSGIGLLWILSALLVLASSLIGIQRPPRPQIAPA